MSYYSRIQALMAKALPGNLHHNSRELHERLRYNNELLKTGREGDYIIKQTALGGGYVQYTYYEPDWFITHPLRRNAAWFKKEELPEVLKNFRKGFRVLKLSKNKH